MWGIDMARKGELKRQALDRNWPFQVALDASDCKGSKHVEMLDFCRPLSLAPRTHSYVENSRYHIVFCFADRDHADRFAGAFGGQMIDPKARPRWPGKRLSG